MHHQILGEITIDASQGDGTATVSYASRQVNVQICPDGGPFQQTLNLAMQVVEGLERLDATAKQVAVAQLLETYNSGRNEYDEAQEDGTLKAVSNPKLSEIEFANKLTLSGITLYGDRMIELFYDDGNMFWGHSIVVISPGGLEFADAYAEVFG